MYQMNIQERAGNAAANSVPYGLFGGAAGAAIPGAALGHYYANDYRNARKMISSIKDDHVKTPGSYSKPQRLAGRDAVVGFTTAKPKVSAGWLLDPRNMFQRDDYELSKLKGRGRIGDFIANHPRLSSLKVPLAAQVDLPNIPAAGLDAWGEALGSGSAYTGGTGARHGFGVSRNGMSTYHGGGSDVAAGMNDLREVLKNPRNAEEAAVIFKLKNGTPEEKAAIRKFMQVANKKEYAGSEALLSGLKNLLFPYDLGRSKRPGPICPPGDAHCGYINNAIQAAKRGGGKGSGLPGKILNNKNLELDTVLLGGKRRAASAAEAKTVLSNALRHSTKGRLQLSLAAAGILGGIGLGAGSAMGAGIGALKTPENKRRFTYDNMARQAQDFDFGEFVDHLRKKLKL